MTRSRIACAMLALGIATLSWGAVPQSLNRSEAAHLATAELGFRASPALSEEEQLMRGARLWLETVAPRPRR